MARLNQTELRTATARYLADGEVIRHCAYGIRQPHFLLIAAAMAFGALPGMILLMLTQKFYVVVLTDRRLLVLRVGQGRRLQANDVYSYHFDKLTKVKISSGLLFTHIRFHHDDERFVAKFHRLGAVDNRPESQAIATALTVGSMSRPMIELPVEAEVVSSLSLSA